MNRRFCLDKYHIFKIIDRGFVNSDGLKTDPCRTVKHYKATKMLTLSIWREIRPGKMQCDW